MILFREMVYCNTLLNKCTNDICKRHLEVKNTFTSLDKNKLNLPIHKEDLSKNCCEYKT